MLDAVDVALALQFDDFVRAGQFIELNIEELKHLLGLKTKEVKSEEDVYKAVIRWINRDVNSRKKYADSLLSYINFAKLSKSFLKEVVASEKLMDNSLACSRAVLHAITSHSEDCLDLSFVAVDDRSVVKFSSGEVWKCLLFCRHQGGSSAKHRNNVYVVGGFDTKSMEKIDINGMTVSKCGSTSKHRYIASCVVLNNTLYVTDGFNAQNTVEGFSCTSRDFSAVSRTNMPSFGCYGHALVSAVGSIYAVGGNGSMNQSLRRLDPSLALVTVLPSMNNKRFGLAAVAFDEKIFAICGSPGHEGLSSSVEKFHLVKNQWSMVASLNVARYRPGACVINNQLVVVGGGSGKIEVGLYDDAEDKWKIVGECEDLKDVFAIFPC